MKKLLILGGANSQTPAIKRAKELGYYVITCDYLPDNPGHKFSDKYINVSTVEKEQVLEVAMNENIDGIIAYASDPSAETAAYVAEKMCLRGANYESTKILAEKDLFRQFQKENGFMYPEFYSVCDKKDIQYIRNEIKFPCFVKPVDSSGSKGISKVETIEELENAYNYARETSRCKRVIIEQEIKSPYYQIHGDGFVYNNKLIFLELGDQRFRYSVPIGSSCPSIIDDDIKEKAIKDVDKLINKVGFSSGGINVEIRVTEKKEIYILEIGPRTGGNYIPQLMETATDFDEMTAALQDSMGDFDLSKTSRSESKYCFQYIIGAHANGTFKELYVSEMIKDKIKHLYIHKKYGDHVLDYHNSSGVVGVAIITFNSTDEMELIINNIDNYIRVILEEDNNEER